MMARIFSRYSAFRFVVMGDKNETHQRDVYVDQNHLGAYRRK